MSSSKALKESSSSQHTEEALPHLASVGVLAASICLFVCVLLYCMCLSVPDLDFPQIGFVFVLAPKGQNLSDLGPFG